MWHGHINIERRETHKNVKLNIASDFKNELGKLSNFQVFIDLRWT